MTTPTHPPPPHPSGPRHVMDLLRHIGDQGCERDSLTRFERADVFAAGYAEYSETRHDWIVITHHGKMALRTEDALVERITGGAPPEPTPGEPPC